jgi:hypothetical protein
MSAHNTIHCQEFHELAMDYRGARPDNAELAYQALLAYINSRIHGSLRDYFAAKALAGIASTVDVNGTVYWREIAADAYAAADAMLAEGAK